MHYLFMLMALVAIGCATTAPTNYELNRRSGLGIDQDREDADDADTIAAEVTNLRTGTATGKEGRLPARIPAVIAKVWVYEQIINKDQWLEGTWLYLAVENEKWLPQVDSGHGRLIEEPVGPEGGK